MDKHLSRDYWNIDDILAEEESVPVKFKVDARGLAFLGEPDQVNPATKRDKKH